MVGKIRLGPAPMVDHRRFGWDVAVVMVGPQQATQHGRVEGGTALPRRDPVFNCAA